MSSSSALAALAFAGLLSGWPVFAEVPRLIAPAELRGLLANFLERPDLGDATEEVGDGPGFVNFDVPGAANGARARFLRGRRSWGWGWGWNRGSGG